MYLYPGSYAVLGGLGVLFLLDFLLSNISVAWIQVHLRMISLSLFLDFESCVLLGKSSTCPGILFIISKDVRQRSKASKASSEKKRIKQIILYLNREIHKLFEEANPTSVSKARKNK